MGQTRDYGCETIALVVLFVLSALSHFWYIMLAVAAGFGIWAMAHLLTRAFLMITSVPVAEGVARERENGGTAIGIFQNAMEGGPVSITVVTHRQISSEM